MSCSVILLALALITTVLVFAPFPVTACECNTSDTWFALSSLYRSTTGQQWHRSDGWLVPGTTVCNWYGFVGCAYLELAENNLVGTLPSEIALLNLAIFNVSYNSIRGSLPEALGSSWVRVTLFDARSNLLSGTLPPHYSDMHSLVLLNLSHNNLSGTLTPAYSNWSDLKYLYLLNNTISGTLPPEYSAWSNLQRLDLSSNNISGTLPADYKTLRSINEFVVASNSILGTLPREYSNWRLIFIFVVSNNNISGSLPPEYAAMLLMGLFYAGNNQLSGTLPVEYSAWGTIVTFDVSQNKLEGTLPQEYSAWGRRIAIFRVGVNALHGTLPFQFSHWTQLLNFHAFNNLFSGTLPPEYSAWGKSLSGFLVAFNRLSGTVPASYANWTNLLGLVLSSNLISGTIPAFVGGYRAVLFLALNDNNFTGTIPQSWASLPTLVLLTLHNNRGLTGTLPESMAPALRASTCNTSLCGALPLQWSLWHTQFFCVHFDIDLYDTFLQFVDFPVSPASLPQCRTSSSSNSTPTTIPSSYVFRDVFGSRNSAVVAATAAGALARISSSVAALHISLHAGRWSRCTSGDTSHAGNPDELDSIGASIADNPTRAVLPGRLSYVAGTVVGNVALLVGVPLLVATLHYAKALLSGRRPTWRPEMYVTPPFWGTLSGLSVPTVGAGTLLLVDVVLNDAAASGPQAVLAVVGLSSAVVPVVLVIWALQRCRSTVRCTATPQAPQRGNIRGGPMLLGHVQHMFAERCRWDLSRVRTKWMSAVLQPLLDGVGARFRWVVVWDVVWMALQGVWIGVGSAPGVSCTVAEAMLWVLFGFCVLSLVVACALRPRQTLFDGVVEVMMHLWTAVTVLLACLDENVDDLTAAQAAMQIFCALPIIVRWCVQRYRSSGADSRACSPRRAAGQSMRAGVAKNSVERLRVSTSGVTTTQQHQLKLLIESITHNTRLGSTAHEL